MLLFHWFFSCPLSGSGKPACKPAVCKEKPCDSKSGKYQGRGERTYQILHPCIYGMTGIAAETFRNNSSLVSLSIPDAVSFIGNYAFAGCSSLVSIDLPDNEPLTKTFTQYGMRYPDGRVRWVKDHPIGSTPVDFQQLSERHPQTLAIWDAHLQQRAAAANIQLSEYREGHELIKRTIIVAVTDAEEL